MGADFQGPPFEDRVSEWHVTGDRVLAARGQSVLSGVKVDCFFYRVHQVPGYPAFIWFAMRVRQAVGVMAFMRTFTVAVANVAPAFINGYKGRVMRLVLVTFK